MTFLRAFSYLVAPAFLLSAALTMVIEYGLPAILSIALVCCAVVAALVDWFSEKVGAVAGILYSGSRQHNTADQFSGNITRARYLKTKGMYTEALVLVDEYLENVPEEPEGLFLKAQVLRASGGDPDLVRRCLFSILGQTQPDEKIHRWAKGLMGEVQG
ncbi:MAG: hypothetical protein VR64_07320 [Desulfatitalea sp. BRH_c12]|nr:MAG: hypothetical protein VR64_07320 [Desulfatitalea sp. BRH_c12]